MSTLKLIFIGCGLSQELEFLRFFVLDDVGLKIEARPGCTHAYSIAFCCFLISMNECVGTIVKHE
jgi:hypothetical protein